MTDFVKQKMNRTMKNRNSVILIGLLMLGLSSCDDFLELPSETNLTSATFFKTQGDFEKAVNGAYAPLRTIYLNTSWLLGEMHSGQYTL
jgi:hypothetical protein